MFYGPGAGGAPTASAVLGDLVTVARNRRRGRARRGGVDVRRPAGGADGRDPDPLPRADRRRRQGGRARRRRAGLRRARRLDPDRPPGGPRRRRPAGRGLAPRQRRRPLGHRRGAARDAQRARRLLGDAGRGRAANEPDEPQWRGVLEEYGDRLDIPDGTPTITLREGGTPMVAVATGSASVTGAEVWLKVEGDNPTGSFKDRGMTVALSVAVGEGAEAVVCASTGNTSASMAAYAARAGHQAARAGAAGQDLRRQDGAGDPARRPGDHGARQLRRLPAPLPRAGRALPGRAGELGEPDAAPGPEDRVLRDRRLPRRRPRRARAADRQRRQHLGVLAGLPRGARGRATRPGCP